MCRLSCALAFAQMSSKSSLGVDPPGNSSPLLWRVPKEPLSGTTTPDQVRLLPLLGLRPASSMSATPVPPGWAPARGSTCRDERSPDSHPAVRRTTSHGPPGPRWAAGEFFFFFLSPAPKPCVSFVPGGARDCFCAA
ncbi:hypothetical protein NDU88_005260 [Pleurodeles waltl]|uniref:Secreted protein n=1 Tax=Pleurodeles waltl TaxID=8319 RepID=A0AAV7PGD8_PLEWA|nr:hypothetical protein NDU88_005260 [Pleurodeles waltl]